jgi:hypothetical protein
MNMNFNGWFIRKEFKEKFGLCCVWKAVEVGCHKWLDTLSWPIWVFWIRDEVLDYILWRIEMLDKPHAIGLTGSLDGNRGFKWRVGNKIK